MLRKIDYRNEVYLKTNNYDVDTLEKGAKWCKDLQCLYIDSSNFKINTFKDNLPFYNKKADVNISNLKSTSLLIGTNIFKNLTNDLNFAQSEILIVSPYISKTNIELLCKIADNNPKINIKLISLKETENKESYQLEAIQSLLRYEKKIDTEKTFENMEKIRKVKNDLNVEFEKKENILKEIEKEKEKLKNTISFQRTLMYLLTLVTLSLPLIRYYIKLNIPFWTYIIPVVLLLIFSNLLSKNKIEEKNKNYPEDLYNKKFNIENNIKFFIDEKLKLENNNFSYLEYSNKFSNLNYKIINVDEKRENYLHLKMYIIDNIAYFGSMNFTYSSFLKNIESLIKIEDNEAIEKLKKYFYNLYDSNIKNFEFVDIQDLGATVFNEEEILKKNI